MESCDKSFLSTITAAFGVTYVYQSVMCITDRFPDLFYPIFCILTVAIVFGAYLHVLLPHCAAWMSWIFVYLGYVFLMVVYSGAMELYAPGVAFVGIGIGMEYVEMAKHVYQWMYTDAKLSFAFLGDVDFPQYKIWTLVLLWGLGGLVARTLEIFAINPWFNSIIVGMGITFFIGLIRLQSLKRHSDRSENNDKYPEQGHYVILPTIQSRTLFLVFVTWFLVLMVQQFPLPEVKTGFTSDIEQMLLQSCVFIGCILSLFTLYFFETSARLWMVFLFSQLWWIVGAIQTDVENTFMMSILACVLTSTMIAGPSIVTFFSLHWLNSINFENMFGVLFGISQLGSLVGVLLTKSLSFHTLSIIAALSMVIVTICLRKIYAERILT